MTRQFLKREITIDQFLGSLRSILNFKKKSQLNEVKNLITGKPPEKILTGNFKKNYEEKKIRNHQMETRRN